MKAIIFKRSEKPGKWIEYRLSFFGLFHLYSSHFLPGITISDMNIHSHSMDFISFIWSGGYGEFIFDESGFEIDFVARVFPAFNYCPRTRFHQIVTGDKTGARTLRLYFGRVVPKFKIVDGEKLKT